MPDLTTIDRLRESILDVLAQSEAPMTSAEIYDRIDSAESKQMLYAQINYLGKAGRIHSVTSGSGSLLHALAEPVVLSASVKKLMDPQLVEAIESGATFTDILPIEHPYEPELEPETAEIATDTTAPAISHADADLHRIVWSQRRKDATNYLTITLDDNQPRMTISGSFAVDPALLRQIAGFIESLQQKEKAD